MTEAPTVIPAIQRYKSLLERADAQALGRLIDAYRAIYNRLEDKIELLIVEIGEKQPTRGQVVRMTRYKQLMKQVADEMQQFQALTKFEVERAAQLGIDLGIRHGRDLISISAVGTPEIASSFNTLAKPAVETIIGMFDPDGALYKRLDQLAITTAQSVTDTIIEGVGLGYNPRKIARQIAKELGGGLTDALRNVRTAQVYAYREANRAIYAANNDVLDGWIWFASLDDRVCMSCVAMHGTRHPISETLNDHYNGRCVPIPIVKGIAPPVTETGEEWFDKQPEARQRKLMGKGKYAAWKDGAFGIGDLTRTQDNEVYGPMRTEQTLKALVGKGKRELGLEPEPNYKERIESQLQNLNKQFGYNVKYRIDEFATWDDGLARPHPIEGERGIIINKKLFENDYYKSVIPKMNKSGWWYGDSLEDIITHEYGHALYNQNTFLKEGFTKEEIEYLLKNPVSIYGKTNEHESFAELFVKYIREGYTSLDDMQSTIIDKYAYGKLPQKVKRKEFIPPKWLTG